MTSKWLMPGMEWNGMSYGWSRVASRESKSESESDSNVHRLRYEILPLLYFKLGVRPANQVVPLPYIYLVVIIAALTAYHDGFQQAFPP